VNGKDTLSSAIYHKDLKYAFFVWLLSQNYYRLKAILMELKVTPSLSLAGYWRDFVRYSELLVFLAGRDLAVRYKQTLAGGLWAVLVPLLSVFVLTFVFGRVAKLEGDGNNYQLMVYAGMLPWGLFVAALQAGATSLIGNINLVTKVYFPRIILPLASMGVAVVDFLLNLLVFIILGMFFGLFPSWRVLTVPLWLLLAMLVAVGPMLILSAWLVRYRDLRFLIPFIIQFGLFITPVGFSTSVVSPENYPYFCINPLVGVIEGFRWALLGLNTFPTFSLVATLSISLFLLGAGIYLFIRAERTMADEL